MCERLAPGVDVEDDLHRGDVYQGDQYADGQGEGAPDSAGLAGGREISRLWRSISYFVRVMEWRVVAVEAPSEGLDISELQDDGRAPQCDEGQAVGDDGPRSYHVSNSLCCHCQCLIVRDKRRAVTQRGDDIKQVIGRENDRVTKPHPCDQLTDG